MPEQIDELYENIVSDKRKKESYDRYPVRFLFFQLSKGLSPYIITLAQKLSAKVRKISDYFPENKWATWESVFSKIEKDIEDSNTDILFLGLSEFLRFENKNSLESIFVNLIGIENTYKNRSDKRRVYFIMDSFEKIFSTFVQENHHRNVFYNPIINGKNVLLVSRCKKPELIISQSVIGKCNILKTVKEYLDLSTRTDYFDFDKKFYCISNTIYSLSKKNSEYLDDSVFPYYLIENKISLLKNKIIGFSTEKSYDEKFIDYLSTGIDMDDNSIDFDTYIKNKLNIDCTTIETLLYKYFDSTDENEKELIILSFELFSLNSKIYSYLHHLFSTYKINTKKEFITQVYLCNDIYVDNVGFNERKEIIGIIFEKDGLIDAPEELIEKFNSELFKAIKNNIYIDSSFNISIRDARKVLKEKEIPEEKISDIYSYYKKKFVDKYLTSKSMIEKRIIILLASSFVFSDRELESYYPELYGYLSYKSPSKEQYDFLDDYFWEYKASKIANIPSKRLKDYYFLTNSTNFLDFYNDDKYKNINNQAIPKNIYVFDGVGAEYISLISYLLEKKYKKKLKLVDYRKSLLPTTTEVNKQLINSLSPKPIWFQEFDSEIIHGEFYSVERNVEKAITQIDKMVKRVIELSNGQSFIIIADHGCTASHKFFKMTKKYDIFPDAEHDGRCCSIFKKESLKPNDDYALYKDLTGKDWIISIKPTSLNNTARYEAHGGGTIEEIFVPYVYYTGECEDITYSINVIKKEVSGIDKSLKFLVSPLIDTEEITIIEETGVVSKPFISEGVYICNLSTGKTQKITIRINNIEETVLVTNSSGINSNKGGFF